MTYFRYKHHDKIIDKIIPMIRGPCGDLNKWILKIRSRVKKFEIGSIKGVFTDFLEFDQTLGMIMEEYNA